MKADIARGLAAAAHVAEVTEAEMPRRCAEVLNENLSAADALVRLADFLRAQHVKLDQVRAQYIAPHGLTLTGDRGPEVREAFDAAHARIEAAGKALLVAGPRDLGKVSDAADCGLDCGAVSEAATGDLDCGSVRGAGQCRPR